MKKMIKSERTYEDEFIEMVEDNNYDVNDQFTYMAGFTPEDWTNEDTETAKQFDVDVAGYYILGDYEGMILAGRLQDIYDFCDQYLGMGLHPDYVCPVDSFDWEDGEWVTGGPEVITNTPYYQQKRERDRAEIDRIMKDWKVNSSRKPIKSGRYQVVTYKTYGGDDGYKERVEFDDYNDAEHYANDIRYSHKGVGIFDLQDKLLMETMGTFPWTPEGGYTYSPKMIKKMEDSIRWFYGDEQADEKIKEWKIKHGIASSRKPVKSGFDITPEQNKFNWAYNDWYGHFHMNLDRVPQYLEGVKWCDANKGSEFYNELCEKYNIYPTGDREKAAFYNALKELGEIENVTSSRKPVKSTRLIKSGPGAGYDVTIRGIEIDNTNWKKLSDEYNEKYDSHTVQVEVPVKPCIAEYWEAEDYYYGVSSEGIMLDGITVMDYDDNDKKIDGGTAILELEVYPPQWIEGDIMTPEELDEAIYDLLPSRLNLTMMYGGGWSHINLPDEGIVFDSNNDRGLSPISLDEEEPYDYYTVRCELKCPNISADINWFFENDYQLEEIFFGEENEGEEIESSKKRKHKTADERAKDEGADITCSRKPVKSACGKKKGKKKTIKSAADRLDMMCMIEEVCDKLRDSVPSSRIDYNMNKDKNSGWIEVVQENKGMGPGYDTMWTFWIDFDNHTVEMLDPQELDLGTFKNDYDIFTNIKNGLNGGGKRPR